MTIYKKNIKRLFDFSFSVIFFIILIPLFVSVGFLLFFTNKRKVFFLQYRVGKKAVKFKVIKFKTMNDIKDKNGLLLPDNDRLIYIGNFLRKTSLDEIPQLVNVIKGDMSLIGPRPLLIEYLPLYTEEQRRRHEIRPGITGWAQVNGRNAISWKEKFQYDVWYVDHVSFLLDMRILLLTVLKVFKREGVNSNSSTTMEYFTGEN
jgi:lipopolysaccharide/colanic/teichoic acid biosynthesis glycosyltransferase